MLPKISQFMPKNESNPLKFMKIGEEEAICINCLQRICKGECKRYKEEMKKLKERKNAKKSV